MSHFGAGCERGIGCPEGSYQQDWTHLGQSQQKFSHEGFHKDGLVNVGSRLDYSKINVPVKAAK